MEFLFPFTKKYDKIPYCYVETGGEEKNMDFLDKLERKIGKHPIHNLMRYVIGCYIIGYIIMYAAPGLLSWLTLEPFAIIHGFQFWRLISWVLIPPSRGIFWAIIMMFFYYQLGTVLEQTWGAFRFNVYIFGGVILTVVGAFVFYLLAGQPVMINAMGYFSTYYLNLSIFLAFALMYPEQQVMLYFIIPIRIKWLAIAYVVLALISAVQSGVVGIVALIASLANFLIFFLLSNRFRHLSPKQIHRRNTWKRQTRNPFSDVNFGGASGKGGAAGSASASSQNNTARRGNTITRHKCAICGRTELDDPNLEFRFCSKCNGNYEYCQDHLFTHIHVK